MHVVSSSKQPGDALPAVGADRNPSNGDGLSAEAITTDQADTRSDAELLSRFVESRDGASFTEIVRRYERLVMGVALRQVGDRDRAEDVFQATFLVLAEKAGRIRRPESLASWLHGTARRVGLAALAESRRHPVMDATDQPGADDPVLAKMQSAYERQVLDEELAALPDRLRLPLVLHYLEGLTARQVADRLGLSVDTIEGRLKKGRKELRRHLIRQGVGIGVLFAAFHMSQQLAAASSTQLVETTAASSLAWANHQPLGACTADAARLAGKEIAVMTAAKTSMLLTCTAVLCLGAGLVGSWAFAERIAAHAGPKTRSEMTRTLPGETSIGDGGESSPPAVSLAAAVDFTEPSEAGRSPRPEVRKYTGWSDGREHWEDVLNNLEWKEQPPIMLLEFAGHLEETIGIPVRIDEEKLNNEGVTSEEELPSLRHRLTLRDALETLCRNLSGVELDYVYEHGVLWITTRSAADEHRETVIYDLQQFDPLLEPEKVIQLIQTITSSDLTWFDIDGVGGTIETLPGAVAVHQTQRGHREIEAVLEQLSEYTAGADGRLPLEEVAIE